MYKIFFDAKIGKCEVCEEDGKIVSKFKKHGKDTMICQECFREILMKINPDLIRE